MEIKDISQLSSFSMIGFWSNNPSNLEYQGSLTSNGKGKFLLKLYDENDPKLLDPHVQPINKTKPVFGHGVINGIFNNKQFHLEAFVSLHVLSNIYSSENMNRFGLTNFYLYDLTSVNIGNWFYTNDSNSNQVNIDITNLTNFFSSSVIHPRFKQNNNNYILTLKNYFKSEKAHFYLPNTVKCSLVQSFSTHNNKERINNNFTGVTTNYDIMFSNLNINITKVIHYKNAILAWFSLITGNNELCSKLTINSKNYIFNIMDRQSNLINKLKLHKYSYVNLIDDHSDWLNNMFYSLKIWLINYKKLYPIFLNINLSNTGTIDQQLQNICVAFEMIYDYFLTSKQDINKRFHRIILSTKIMNVLKNMDPNFLEIAMNSLNIKSIYNFTHIIKQFRNELSHNTQEADENNIAYKITLLQILKALVRDWILTYIMINRKYINESYNYKNPFNTYSLYHNN